MNDEHRTIAMMRDIVRIGASMRETCEQEESTPDSKKRLRSLASEAASLLSSSFDEVGEAVEVFLGAFDASMSGDPRVDQQVIVEEILSCWIFIRAAACHPGTRPMVSFKARREFAPKLSKAVGMANFVRAARTVLDQVFGQGPDPASTGDVN